MVTIFSLHSHRPTAAHDAAGTRARLGIAFVLCMLASSAAHASFLSGDALDTMADWVAIIVLIVVPVGVIVLFWLIHILPEKVAEKRHHPQKDAITTLCLLSLFFGGLLWPLAWLWAYSRPVAYRAAYGTDKHDDYFVEMGDKAKGGALPAAEIDHLRQELDTMAARGQLPANLQALRKDLDELKVQASASATPTSSKDRTV